MPNTPRISANRNRGHTLAKPYSKTISSASTSKHRIKKGLSQAAHHYPSHPIYNHEQERYRSIHYAEQRRKRQLDDALEAPEIKRPRPHSSLAFSNQPCPIAKLSKDMHHLLKNINKNKKETDEIKAELTRAIDRYPSLRYREVPLHNLIHIANKFSQCRWINNTCNIFDLLAQDIINTPNFEQALHQLYVNSPYLISLLVNALSKWGASRSCCQTMNSVANHIVNWEKSNKNKLSHFNQREISSLVNGFSKQPHGKQCQRVLEDFARHVQQLAQQALGLNGFNGQDIANLVNGLSKHPQNAVCTQALEQLAQQALGLNGFNGQDIANLVNGLSKHPQNAVCTQALERLAHHVLLLEKQALGFNRFNEQEIANLVNGLSKHPQNALCTQALERLAHHLLQLEKQALGFNRFNEQEIANLVNGLSKHPQNALCTQALERLAHHVLQLEKQALGFNRFNEQEIANLVNGWVKHPQNALCAQALERLACHVLLLEKQTLGLNGFHEQAIANLVNGLCHGIGQNECFEETLCALAAHINLDIEKHLNKAHSSSTMLIGFGRCLSKTALTLGNKNTEEIRRIQRYIADQAEQQIDQFLPLHFSDLQSTFMHHALFLKGLMLSQLTNHSIVPKLLEQLENLLERLVPSQNNIDNRLLYVLAQGLMPFLGGNEQSLKDKSLAILYSLQVLIQPWSNTRTNSTQTSARALFTPTYIALRQAYQLAIRTTDHAKEKERLREFVDDLEKSHLAQEVQDISEQHWDDIANIEETLRIKGIMPAQITNLTRAASAPRLPFQHVFSELNHSPRRANLAEYALTIPVVNFNGQHYRRQGYTPDAKITYCVLARLTQKQLPLIEVKLPGRVSAEMLRTPIRYMNEDYAIYFAGGSKMKGERDDRTNHGSLIGIPSAHIAQHTDFANLMRTFFPNQESFFYFQRMLLASAPRSVSVNELDQSDKAPHILEGEFNIAFLKDCTNVEVHPFRLAINGTPIALRTHDGCGFIKRSMIKNLSVIKNAENAAPYGGKSAESGLPSQASQQYLNDERVLIEMQKNWQKPGLLSSLPDLHHSQDHDKLFHFFTKANIKGHIAIAVPSNDEHIHLPRSKSLSSTPNSLLIGRAPYCKPNLRPISKERIKTSDNHDATAQFLDHATIIQYSFIGMERQMYEDDQSKGFFSKGLLIVVNDENWPEDFQDRHWVASC